jgi:hypothetical protein
MKISVITPSFRNSDWLKLCIASVADQGVDLEHIVQDSCSDDATQEWLPNDSRVKAFIEKDGGMYDAINRGLRRASGDILAYLNCDEQYVPVPSQPYISSLMPIRMSKCSLAMHWSSTRLAGTFAIVRRAFPPVTTVAHAEISRLSRVRPSSGALSLISEAFFLIPTTRPSVTRFG